MKNAKKNEKIFLNKNGTTGNGGLRPGSKGPKRPS